MRKTRSKRLRDGSRRSRTKELKNIMTKRDSQHNPLVDLTALLSSVLEDIAYVEEHNRNQINLNPNNIRAGGLRRSRRFEDSTLPGVRRRARHLIDIRTAARASQLRRRSRGRYPSPSRRLTRVSPRSNPRSRRK